MLTFSHLEMNLNLFVLFFTQLIVVICSRPSEDRTIPLSVIAERTKLSIENVEHLLMKSLSVSSTWSSLIYFFFITIYKVVSFQLMGWANVNLLHYIVLLLFTLLSGIRSGGCCCCCCLSCFIVLPKKKKLILLFQVLVPNAILTPKTVLDDPFFLLC